MSARINFTLGLAAAAALSVLVALLAGSGPASIADMLAVLTGAFVALYTTFDAYGIRATADPFTFLAWFFVIDGLFIPLMIRHRLRAVPAGDWAHLARRGFLGAIIAFGSFGGIMLATRLGQVGQAAVLRETSTVFAALIGWLMLGEQTGPRRVFLMGLIAAGAVAVQLAA